MKLDMVISANFAFASVPIKYMLCIRYQQCLIYIPFRIFVIVSVSAKFNVITNMAALGSICFLSVSILDALIRSGLVQWNGRSRNFNAAEYYLNKYS
jgi:hypothetical protein